MAPNVRYIGTMDTGKSNVNSRAEISLEKSGKAYLDFDQGDIHAGKIGIKGFKLHDKLSASLWYQPESNKGNLELIGDVGHDTTVTVSPNYPLPSDLMQVPVKLVTRQKVKAVDAKVTALPLKKSAEIELGKNLSHTKHFKRGTLTINHPKDTIALELQTKQYEFQDIKHDLRLTMMTPFGSSTEAAKNTLLYTGEVSSDLKIKAEMCQPKAKGNLARLSAVYKMGDVEAVASCDLNSEKQLVNSNLMLKTTLDI